MLAPFHPSEEHLDCSKKKKIYDREKAWRLKCVRCGEGGFLATARVRGRCLGVSVSVWFTAGTSTEPWGRVLPEPEPAPSQQMVSTGQREEGCSPQ